MRRYPCVLLPAGLLQTLCELTQRNIMIGAYKAPDRKFANMATLRFQHAIMSQGYLTGYGIVFKLRDAGPRAVMRHAAMSYLFSCLSAL